MSKIIPTTILYLGMSVAVAAATEEKKNMSFIKNYNYHQSSGSSSVFNAIALTERYENPFFKQEEEKINKFYNLKHSKLSEAPNKESIDVAKEIFNVFKDNGIKIQSTSPMADGGVSFEFFNKGAYCAIEIYNNQDIVYSKKPHGKDSKIQDLSLSEIKAKLNAEFNFYGD